MKCEGNSRRVIYRDETEEIKKGPWKPEEDQVLMNHVRKYGPRDWSSIRSKGLLKRTGKSCRLRWVNKLRPDLKNGVKFSAEEERMVIDLQAQFGNKWAKIATYLTGRTDNDVKNFWSSRQKRLARIQHNSASPSKSIKTTLKNPAFHDVPSREATKFCYPPDAESVTKSKSCSSHMSDTDSIKLVPQPDHLMLLPSSNQSYKNIPFQLECILEKKPPFLEQPPSYLSYPSFPQLQHDFLESHEFIPRLGDPGYLDVFGQLNEPEMGSAPLSNEPLFFGSSQQEGKVANHNIVTPDCIMDDFPPMDMFDEIERLPSPSKWP